MSIGRDFWLPINWGHVFNQRRIVNGRVNYHKGHDISRRGRTYALRGGRIVRIRRSSVLGLVITIEVRPGVFDHYSHQRNPLPIGTRVAQFAPFAWAETNARLAGSAWQGAHTHLATGGDDAWIGIGVLNATSLILQVIAATKPGGTIPATPKPPVVIPTPDIPTPEEEDTMTQPITIIALRRKSGPDYTAKCSVTAIPGGWEETTNTATADEFYSAAGVDEPHRVFSGNVLPGGDQEAAAKYNRAKAGFAKARADYLIAKGEERVAQDKAAATAAGKK